MRPLALLPLLFLAACGGGGGPVHDDGKVRIVNADPTSDPVEVLVDGTLRQSVDFGDTLDLINGGADFELVCRTEDETTTKTVRLTREKIDSIVLTRDGFRTVHDKGYDGSGSVRVRVLIDETNHNLDVVLTNGSHNVEDALERWTDVSKSGEPTSHKFGAGTHRLLAVEPGTDTVVAESDTFTKSNGDLFVMVREDGDKYLRRFQK